MNTVHWLASAEAGSYTQKLAMIDHLHDSKVVPSVRLVEDIPSGGRSDVQVRSQTSNSAVKDATICCSNTRDTLERYLWLLRKLVLANRVGIMHSYSGSLEMANVLLTWYDDFWCGDFKRL